jgi:hypothetical protein
MKPIMWTKVPPAKIKGTVWYVRTVEEAGEGRERRLGRTRRMERTEDGQGEEDGEDGGGRRKQARGGGEEGWEER